MFAVLGEALLDMVQPGPGTTYVARPGGGPFNIAIGLRRLGHRTALLARMSSGGLGHIVRDHAVANDLDLTATVATADQTTLAFASLDEEGRASYDFYVRGTADWGWRPTELERLHEDDDVLVSFDPNIRPALAGPHGEAVRRVERFVAASDVVKASDEDLGWLYPGLDLADAARRWADLGPSFVVVTRGAEGCLAVTRAGELLVRPSTKVELVDTIGAGDAFESGLLSGLVDAGAYDAVSLAGLSVEALSGVLDRAVLVSGMTCEQPGADPPTREEYEARAAATEPLRS